VSEPGRPRSLDLAIACGLAALGLLVSIFSPGGWLQAAALAPLALAVPGYAIAAALFPPGAIEREDRLVYSFVFSVSAAALGGLVLQIVLPLDRGAWLGLLVLLTFAAGVVAQWRRATLPIQHASAPPIRPPGGVLWAIAFLTALTIAGGAITIAAGGVREQQSRQRFASLWALPVKAAEGGATRVEVGVWNHGGPAAYRLEVSRDERAIQNLRLRLGPNQRWHIKLGPRISAAGPLLLTLYHRSAPYRNVELGHRGTP